MDKNVRLLKYERLDNFFTKANNYIAYDVPKDDPPRSRTSSIMSQDRSSCSGSHVEVIADSDDSSGEELDHFIPNKPMTFPRYGSTPPLVDNSWFGSAARDVISLDSSSDDDAAASLDAFSNDTLKVFDDDVNDDS